MTGIRTAILVTVAALVLPTGTSAAGATRDLIRARMLAVRVVGLVVQNRYAEAWASLYPLHQQAAPLDRYVACENESAITVGLAGVRVLRVWTAAVRAAGAPRSITGAKVRLRIVLADESLSEQFALVKTVSLVRVAGRWAWILPPARYAAYAAGDCPS